jgi:hypothetical protein
MDQFYIIDNCPTNKQSFIYISLDTAEGDCVGHWIWECALFLPYLKQIQIPFKILLRTQKSFKTNILADFGYNDIIYSPNMVQDPHGSGTWQEHYVVPQESEYIMYVPKFFYLWNTSMSSTLFFESLTLFRNHYLEKIPNHTKSIPLSYVQRSRDENYTTNFRTFMNQDDFEAFLHQHHTHMINTDQLTSLTPQFQDIIQSNTIIVEMGSAFTINAAFFASNSHIIVINDIFNYHECIYPFFNIFRKLMEERKNTIEIFSYGSNKKAFHVDIPEFKDVLKRISLNRTCCIICNHSEFETINSFPHFPIMAISNELAIEQFFDFTFITCNRCKCLQLKYHVDPSILYSDVYMNAYFSPLWKDHHEQFSNFILNNTNASSFLEIGANRGDLYNLLSKEKAINYTTLDMFKHSELPSDIRFVHGNCESFDFTGFTSIILSHVFEHLYSPRTCIANLRKANVYEVFISIPNFDQLLEERSLQLLNSQHIFYCGINYIIYLFSLFNYRCNTHFSCDGNLKSNMFHFVSEHVISPVDIPSISIQLYKEIYVDGIKKIQQFQVPSHSYIAPSGMYGQFFYYFLNQKENVIGFLDNNTQRHNKKLYGTDKLVYSPHNIDYCNATIIVCKCPYQDEIIQGLKQIYDSIHLLIM